MNGWDWQTIVAGATVTAAAFYLGRRAWLVVAGRSGSACHGCRCAVGTTLDPSQDPAATVVPLQAVTRSAERVRSTP
jgi:hypothetical protein